MRNKGKTWMRRKNDNNLLIKLQGLKGAMEESSRRAKWMMRERGRSPLERLQTRHGHRCSCYCLRPAVANFVRLKAALKRWNCVTMKSIHQRENLKYSLKQLETGMTAEAVANRSGPRFANATSVQPVVLDGRREKRGRKENGVCH